MTRSSGTALTDGSVPVGGPVSADDRPRLPAVRAAADQAPWLVPDADDGSPDDPAAWLWSTRQDQEAVAALEELGGLVPAEDAEVLPGLPPGRPVTRAGFNAGGAADLLPPGVALAGLAVGAWDAGLGRLSDDELAGVMLAWRRLGSWAAAGEMAAVAELSRRRTSQAAAGADPHLAEHVTDELALALTLTGRAAAGLLDFADALERLPLTRAALAAGEIDRAKACVIADEVTCLEDGHAALVEAAVIGRAPGQTTGQLRAAARRAALAADPAAARRRREKARQDARVEVWNEHAGTAALAGRDLPPAEVVAADQRISALARRLKRAGRGGTLDQLRAAVYTALLLGQPMEDLMPPPAEPLRAAEIAGAAEPGGAVKPGAAAKHDGAVKPGAAAKHDGAAAAGGGVAAMAGLGGSVNLTMPLSAWLGGGTEPGEVAGFGAVPADDARALASLLTRRPGARWCLTLTGQSGRAIAHGCATLARAGPPLRRPGAEPPGDPWPDGEPGWALTVTIKPLAVGECAHEREGGGYHPSASLRHLINIRQRTCSFPACRRAADRCDLDHTVPYDSGGRTCECGLAPLCRRHHRAKQAQGWLLEQPEPGVLRWRLPHGRSYRAAPDPYPG